MTNYGSALDDLVKGCRLQSKAFKQANWFATLLRVFRLAR